MDARLQERLQVRVASACISLDNAISKWEQLTTEGKEHANAFVNSVLQIQCDQIGFRWLILNLDSRIPRRSVSFHPKQSVKGLMCTYSVEEQVSTNY